MDGRTQLPVIEWIRRQYGIDSVDSITEPGPVRILCEAPGSSPAAAIRGRLAISVEKHSSRRVVVVAHQDCAGNPVDDSVQFAQLRRSVKTVRSWGFEAEVVGVWVGENWSVEPVA